MPVSNFLRSFHRKEDGAIAVVAVLMLLPTIVMAGAAVDLSVAYSSRSALKNATDVAASIGSSMMHKDVGRADTAAKAAAQKTFLTASQSPAGEASFAMSANTKAGTYTAKGSVEVATFFLPLVGIKTMEVNATSIMQASIQSLELALVVDNSGSMRSSMGALRTALADFATEITDMQKNGEIKVSLIPYASAVNVGADNASAPWIDHRAKSPLHQQGFAEPINRFDLYESIGAAWKGCVMARQGNRYALTDAPSNQNVPASLFVPMFAPDGPGGKDKREELDGYIYANSYLADDKGACERKQKKKTLSDMTPTERQERVCKYEPKANASPNSIYNKNKNRDAWNIPSGPNAGCDPEPLLPLTSSVGKFKDRAATLEADGNTNTTEGVLWGWRTLSPNGPFGNALPNDDEENRKVMIVMADGENYMGPEDHGGGYNGINWSIYTPYGPASAGVFDASKPRSQHAITRAMDKQTQEACDNVKAAKIEIWTIGYGLRNGSGKTLLRNCASAPDMFVDIKTASDLKTVFADLARRIEKRRYTY